MISWCIYLIVLGGAYICAMSMAIFLAVMGDWGAVRFLVLAVATGWLSYVVYRAKPLPSGPSLLRGRDSGEKS